MRQLFSVLLLLTSAQLFAQAEPPQELACPVKTLDDGTPYYTGVYCNIDYGYRVDLPAKIVGVGSAATNHGFGIDVANATEPHDWKEFPARYLYVDASYDAFEAKNLEGAVALKLEWSQDKNGRMQLMQRAKMMLDGVAAQRIALRDDKTKKITEFVLAYYRGIIYTLSLDTDTAHYEADGALLKSLVKGFRFQKIWPESSP